MDCDSTGRGPCWAVGIYLLFVAVLLGLVLSGARWQRPIYWESIVKEEAK